MATPVPQSTVIVRGGANAFKQEITAGRHRLSADEPLSVGGDDSGPTPYDLLLASLGACTSMTVAMYARRKAWPLGELTVELRHFRIHVTDCENCETERVMLDRIECDITLSGDLTADQRTKLHEIANKCPVHRTLTSTVDVRTRVT